MSVTYYLIKTKFDQPASDELEKYVAETGLNVMVIDEGHDLTNETMMMLRNSSQIQYIPSLLAIDDDDKMRIHEVSDHQSAKDFHVKSQEKFGEKVNKNGK